MKHSNNSHRLMIGDPVIMSAYDRPCSGLVAIVTKIADDLVTAIYLSKETTIETAITPKREVTKLTEFGVILRFEHYQDPLSWEHKDLFWAEQVDSSAAIYPDTLKSRKWQESAPVKQTIRPEALVVFLRNLDASKQFIA